MRKFFVAAALAVVAMFGTTTSADAAFKVRYSINGGAFVTVQDGQAVADVNPDTGGIAIMVNNDPNVTFTIFGGQSKPLYGNSPYLAIMDISIFGSFKTASQGGSGGTLVVDITDTDFLPPPASPAGNGTLVATIGSSAPSGTTFDGYLQGGTNGNKEFGGIDSTTGTIISATGATAPGNLVVKKDGIALAPYSLTARTTFSGSAGSGFSIDNTIAFAVPAPAGLVLALTATPLFGVGAWIRRRRAPKVA